MLERRIRGLGSVLLSIVLFAACAHREPRSPPSAAAPASAPSPSVASDRPAALPRAEMPAEPLRTLEAMPPDATTYDIDQTIDDASGSFAGKALIGYTNTTGAPLTTLPLLLHPNAGAELGVAASDTGSISVSEVTALAGPRVTFAPTRRTMVTVRFASPVPPKGKIALAVKFAGKLRQLGADANDMMSQAMSSMASLAGGKQIADYGLLAMGDGIVTAASAYPMIAPYREGAFDTTPPPRFGDLAYNSVAAFRVHTTVPSGLRVVTNLTDRPPLPTDPGHEVITSEGRFVRDLVLVAARDFEHESRTQAGTRITSYYRARDAKAGHAVLEAGAASLASLERRFGPYAWPELHLAEATIVGGAAGVEFCGMALVAGMFYRPIDLSNSPLAGLLGGSGLDEALGDGAEPSSPRATSPRVTGAESMMGDQLEFVVAHEVAHQYFAGMVGNDSRRYAALDEPLAQYAAGLVMEDRHGSAAGAAAFDKNVKLGYAMYRAMGGVDHDAARDTHAYRTSTEYAGLVYGKAPYVYVALRRALGDDALHRMIRGAIERTKFRVVTLDEWTAALEASAANAGEKALIRPAFRRYLSEAHGDQDLGIDDSGDFLVAHMLPGGMGQELAGAMKAMGLKPKDLLQMLLGGATSPP